MKMVNPFNTYRRRIALALILSCGLLCASSLAQDSTLAKGKPTATQVLEIGAASNKVFAKRWKNEFWKLYYESVDQFFIINYGSNTQIAQREKLITDSIAFRNFDRIRITLVRGGPDGRRTVVWKVPHGADNPKP